MLERPDPQGLLLTGRRVVDAGHREADEGPPHALLVGASALPNFVEASFAGELAGTRAANSVAKMYSNYSGPRSTMTKTANAAVLLSLASAAWEKVKSPSNTVTETARITHMSFG